MEDRFTPTRLPYGGQSRHLLEMEAWLVGWGIFHAGSTPLLPQKAADFEIKIFHWGEPTLDPGLALTDLLEATTGGDTLRKSKD